MVLNKIEEDAQDELCENLCKCYKEGECKAYQEGTEGEEMMCREPLKERKCAADGVLQMISEYKRHFKVSGDPIMKRGECLECGITLHADTEEELLIKIGIHNDMAHKVVLEGVGVTTNFVGKRYVPKKRKKVKAERVNKDEEVAEWV